MILDQTRWAVAEMPPLTASGHIEIVFRTVTKREAQTLRVSQFPKLADRRRYAVIPLKGKVPVR